MSVVVVFFYVVAGLSTVMILVGSFIFAIAQESWRLGAVSAALWALGITGLVLLIGGKGDPYPNLLCLSGHQQWVIVSNGKTTYREKAWYCDRMEAP